MKTVLILFDPEDWNNKMHMGNREYLFSYENLYTQARKRAIQFCRASIAWYDPNTAMFRYAWTYVNGEWTVLYDVTPDLIFDKIPTDKTQPLLSQIEIIQKNFRIVNDPQFSSFIDNKLYTHLLFPQYTKKSHLVSSAAERDVLIPAMTGEYVVLKPVYGSQGKGVHIVKKEQAYDIEITGLTLLEEFIDSEKGIPGITNERHDLRLLFANDHLLYTYIRTPEKGSFLANIAQGGTKHLISPDLLPQSVHMLAQNVLDAFSVFPKKLFSLDIMFDENQRPWIVELGSKPGMFFSPDQIEPMNEVHHSFISFFDEILNESSYV